MKRESLIEKYLGITNYYTEKIQLPPRYFTVHLTLFMLDRNLKLTAHVNHVFKVSMYHLRNISTIRRYLTPEDCQYLVHALVTSRIGYYNSLLYGSNYSLIHLLQLVQNYAARVIVRIPIEIQPRHGPVLKDLHWLPVKARIEFKILFMMFQVYVDMVLHILKIISTGEPLYALGSDPSTGYC